jgi:hypothetical protein
MADCVLHESEVQTWPVKEVTLSALLAADLCLSDVTTAAAAESAAAAHPGVAPLALCTLSYPDTPLWLTLSILH